MTELAELMAMDRTTLTRNLRPLEKEALAAVTPGADRRTRSVALTAAGRSRLEQALPAWRQAQAYMAEQLGAAQWRSLRRMLDAATDIDVPD